MILHLKGRYNVYILFLGDVTLLWFLIHHFLVKKYFFSQIGSAVFRWPHKMYYLLEKNERLIIRTIVYDYIETVIHFYF